MKRISLAEFRRRCLKSWTSSLQPANLWFITKNDKPIAKLVPRVDRRKNFLGV